MAFYWIGIVTMLACLALVLASNTDFVYSFEHTRFPLSWTLAALAVFAFLVAELCHPADSLKSEAENEDPQLAPEWEAIEAQV
jgi:hypothetical protein